MATPNEPCTVHYCPVNHGSDNCDFAMPVKRALIKLMRISTVLDHTHTRFAADFGATTPEFSIPTTKLAASVAILSNQCFPLAHPPPPWHSPRRLAAPASGLRSLPHMHPEAFAAHMWLARHTHPKSVQPRTRYYSAPGPAKRRILRTPPLPRTYSTWRMCLG